MNYWESDKYTKIEKFSETIKKITLSDRQIKQINDILIETSAKSNELKDLFTIDKRVFMLPMVLLEGESSSLIEGTRSMFEDFSYDIEEMNNIPQWETRNLINLYDKYIFNEYYKEHLTLSSGTIEMMHTDFFEVNPDSKFKMSFDTSHRIRQVKPGVISRDDTKPNFISTSSNIKDATVILLKPSLKEEYLSDLLDTISSKINDDQFLIKHIMISHPIFEAIHPFADGNGRMGRLLISLLFNKINKNISMPFYMSEVFNETKDEYKQKLQQVQLNNDSSSWNDWIEYFITCLQKTKDKTLRRIDEITGLWKQLIGSKALSTEVRQYITKAFFKYYKINKQITLKNIRLKFPKLSIQSIYNDWNTVEKELNLKHIGSDYYSYEPLLSAIRS